MRVVIAPSGFKENLDAEAVAAAIADGVRRACPGADIIELPLADGGEGTCRTMARITGGTLYDASVTGPIGEPVQAYYAILGQDGGAHVGERVAVVELAAAAGLKLVPRDRRDPSRTTTRGLGELIALVLEGGATRIIVGCGDSGVNDGGAGLARALGARLLNADGVEVVEGGLGLADIARIDLSGLDPRLVGVPIEVACNITNVLCGEHGVARVFGPQKGASPEEVDRLADALDHYAAVIKRDIGPDVRTMPGGGASGGVGAGLHALLGASLRSRFDILLPYFGLDAALTGADLVLTAEGGIDFKTTRGKVPAEIGERACAKGIPVIAFAGTIGEGAEHVREHGIVAYFSTPHAPETLNEAMAIAEDELAGCAENVMRTVLVGIAIANQRSPDA